MSAPDGSREVGYGRPPVHTRFQKGRSGTPGGQRKGQPSVRELILREATREDQERRQDRDDHEA